MRVLAFTFLLMMTTAPAFAQEATGDPIEITAQSALEWDRDNQLYKAIGEAQVTQGTLTINADNMDAAYEGDQSNLTLITARDNVVIKDTDKNASGDKLVYDVTKEQAILTGSNLKLNATDLVVTARDSFVYNRSDGSFTATGNAYAVQTKDNQDIRASRLTAEFTNDNDLKAMKASGDVTITVGEDIIKGDNAHYDAIARTANVTGTNVTLTRDQNILTGQRATVDLNTNISKLYGAPEKPATATFYPGSTKKSDAP